MARQTVDDVPIARQDLRPQEGFATALSRLIDLSLANLHRQRTVQPLHQVGGLAEIQPTITQRLNGLSCATTSAPAAIASISDGLVPPTEWPCRYSAQRGRSGSSVRIVDVAGEVHPGCQTFSSRSKALASKPPGTTLSSRRRLHQPTAYRLNNCLTLRRFFSSKVRAAPVLEKPFQRNAR